MSRRALASQVSEGHLGIVLLKIQGRKGRSAGKMTLEEPCRYPSPGIWSTWESRTGRVCLDKAGWESELGPLRRYLAHSRGQWEATEGFRAGHQHGQGGHVWRSLSQAPGYGQTAGTAANVGLQHSPTVASLPTIQQPPEACRLLGYFL